MQSPSSALDNQYNTTPMQRGAAEMHQTVGVDMFPIPGGSPFNHTPREARIKQSQRATETARGASVRSEDDLKDMMRARAIANAREEVKSRFPEAAPAQQPLYTPEEIASLAQYSLQLGNVIHWVREQSLGEGASK